MSASIAPPFLRSGPLLIRLCNWVGEAVLSLPALRLLEQQGYELHLVGKGWANSLFEGHGWTVLTRPNDRWQSIIQLRRWRAEQLRRDAGLACRPNHLLFTNSLSSALESRLGGLRPIGYRRDGRAGLLTHGVPFVQGLHAADNYWRIATHFLNVGTDRSGSLGLRPSPAQQVRAGALLDAQNLRAVDTVLLCPFSGADDTTGKKRWPGFTGLANRLHQQGQQVVLCPGPGETIWAREQFPHAVLLEGVDLGTYAALGQQVSCTVSNDTGPGHLVAAAGGRLVSVLGPDGADMWFAQGDGVVILRPARGWSTLDEVWTAVEQQAGR